MMMSLVLNMELSLAYIQRNDCIPLQIEANQTPGVA